MATRQEWGLSEWSALQNGVHSGLPRRGRAGPLRRHGEPCCPCLQIQGLHRSLGDAGDRDVGGGPFRVRRRPGLSPRCHPLIPSTSAIAISHPASGERPAERVLLSCPVSSFITSSGVGGRQRIMSCTDLHPFPVRQDLCGMVHEHGKE